MRLTLREHKSGSSQMNWARQHRGSQSGATGKASPGNHRFADGAKAVDKNLMQAPKRSCPSDKEMIQQSP